MGADGVGRGNAVEFIDSWMKGQGEAGDDRIVDLSTVEPESPGILFFNPSARITAVDPDADHQVEVDLGMEYPAPRISRYPTLAILRNEEVDVSESCPLGNIVVSVQRPLVLGNPFVG